MSFLNKIKKNLINAPGWQTNKKIVVIESDDWGSVSMPSLDVYKKLLKNGVPVDKSSFSMFDSLESEDDLNELFHVLTSHKDFKGSHPIITACAVVANPDFEKIKASGMRDYFYEPITETYKKYPNHSKSFEIWKNGIENRLLWPQFHGREHLNPKEWLKCLNSGDKSEMLAFENKTLLALTNPIVSKRKLGYMSAFDFETIDELNSFEEIIESGLNLFEYLFGFRSTSFVAPTSVRSDKMDSFLFKNGIKYHQMGQQTLPFAEDYKIKDRRWGNKNQFGQIYWRRNTRFEPSITKNDWVESVLNDADIAFRRGKPIVISSHRVNFIGGLVKENRENTLKLLDSLLNKLLKKYQDIEFMSSDQLGEEIKNNPSYFLGLNL